MSKEPGKTRERRISFKRQMALQVNRGLKTQTRRVIDLSRIKHPVTGIWMEDGQWIAGNVDSGRFEPAECWHSTPIVCPYGVPGNRLWMQEDYQILRSGTGGRVVVRYLADDTEAKVKLSLPEFAKFACRAKPYAAMPGRFMYRSLSRTVLEITQVRVERIQEISGADAIAEGFDKETCASVLHKAAKGLEPAYAGWIEGKDLDCLDGTYCLPCARKKARKADKVCECLGAEESDGPAFCDACYDPILMSLSEYGIDRELFLESDLPENVKHFPARGSDACVAAMIADGYGDFKEEKHMPRLAQIGLATLWDEINYGRGEGFGWVANPWVFALTFKILEKGQ